MSVIWHKVWFDLWNRKGRTALAVLSIAAGVFAIGMIFGMVDQLLGTMDAAHIATRPAHLVVVTAGTVDEAMADSILNVPGVTGVEPMNLRVGRYKTAVDEPWQSATIIMRQDYTDQAFDEYSLLDGAWPTRREIGVERLSQNYYGLTVGDNVILELPGTDRSYEIGGVIRHPFVPPPDFGGDTYFLVSPEVMAQLGVPRGQYNQILVQIAPYSEAYAKDRAAAIKEHLNKQGRDVFLTLYQEPETHWGRQFVEGVTLVLQVLAVVSLAASVILVINTMTAIITQQTDQIGVIKAIGGSAGTITRIYLAGVLVYGVLALLVALPLGMIGAYLASKQLLGIFNIEYDTFAYSTTAVLAQIAAALVAPLLAALWPVWQGARISVREAIASYGLGGDFGFSRFDRWVDKVGARFLPTPYAIALGNMFRRKGRLLLSQLVLIAAGSMFITVLTLSASLTTTLENELNRRGYDIRIAFPRGERQETLLGVAQGLTNLDVAEAWYTIPGTVLREGQRVQDTAGLGAELFAVPAGSQMYNPNITRGRWLTAADTGRVVVMSQETADFNNLELGDSLTIDLGLAGKAEWTLVGTYQAVAPEPFATDPIYAPATAVLGVTRQANIARQLLIRTQNPTAENTNAALLALREEFEMRNMPINMFVTRTIFAEREYAYNQFAIVTNLLLVLAVVMGTVGGIGLMGSLSISVVERTREIGVLRAIGAETPTIVGMFVMEGVLQGFLSWLLAVPLALLTAWPLARLLGLVMVETALDFAFSYTAVFAWLGITLLIGALASIIPAVGASRISVRESLAYA
jgi:putative ABC transport system permease protein